MADEDRMIPLSNVITIDDERIKNHLDRVVRGTVEETLNALLDAEADRLCNAQRYERSAARRDTRAPPLQTAKRLRCCIFSIISRVRVTPLELQTRS